MAVVVEEDIGKGRRGLWLRDRGFGDEAGRPRSDGCAEGRLAERGHRIKAVAPEVAMKQAFGWGFDMESAMQKDGGHQAESFVTAFADTVTAGFRDRRVLGESGCVVPIEGLMGIGAEALKRVTVPGFRDGVGVFLWIEHFVHDPDLGEMGGVGGFAGGFFGEAGKTVGFGLLGVAKGEEVALQFKDADMEGGNSFTGGAGAEEAAQGGG